MECENKLQECFMASIHYNVLFQKSYKTIESICSVISVRPETVQEQNRLKE